MRGPEDYSAGAVGGPLEQQSAFALVLRHRSGALEFTASLIGTPQLGEQIAAHTGKQVVILEQRLGGECIDDAQPGLGAEQHGERDGAVSSTIGEGMTSPSSP